jgi:hypothetical protein
LQTVPPPEENVYQIYEQGEMRMRSGATRYLMIIALFSLMVAVPLSVSAEEVEVIETGVSDPQNEAPVLPINPVEFEIEDNFIKIDGISMEQEIIEFENGEEMLVRKEPGRENIDNEIQLVHSTLEGILQLNVDLDVPQGCGECQVGD